MNNLWQTCYMYLYLCTFSSYLGMLALVWLTKDSTPWTLRELKGMLMELVSPGDKKINTVNFGK